MKETVEFNYNIEINELNEDNNIYSFFLCDKLYMFVLYKRSPEEIVDIINCSKELKQKNILSMDLMYNKDNDVLTKVDEELYVLIKVIDNYNENVDITDIIEINQKTILKNEHKDKYVNKWGELWSQKNDYLEYQISELGKGKNIILDSFSYYIGIAENAIAIVNKMNKDNDLGKNEKVCLSHRRIFFPNYKLNYYNPISYLFDLEIRDIAEYIKSLFFYGEDAYLEFLIFIKTVKLTNYSSNMFFARLLYPSYYFDIYENIIDGNNKEKEMINIISKADDYETFLKKVYLELSKYTNIEKIEWLLN